MFPGNIFVCTPEEASTPAASTISAISTSPSTSARLLVEPLLSTPARLLPELSPSSMMASRSTGPDFSLCGTFGGKKGQSATRWLKKLEWELKRYASEDGSVSPINFIQAFDLLLVDDAASWAETTQAVVELIEDPEPTGSTVETLKSLFVQQYPTRVVEVPVTNFDTEISELGQQEGEALLAYYRRTLSLLSRIGCRDRPKKITPTATELTSLESAMLDTVLRAFVRGLRDGDLRRDALRGLVSQDRSLLAVYSMTEESRRAKSEYTRLQEELVKSQELQFYRDLAQRNMSAQQIASLKATYTSNLLPAWNYYSPPNPYQPPQTYPQHPSQTAARTIPATQEYYPNNRRDDHLPPPSYQHNGSGYQHHQPNYGPQSLPNPSMAAAPPALQQGQRSNGSSNPFVNGTTPCGPGTGRYVCIKCGEEGHISKGCDNKPMARWEQDVIRGLVMPNRDTGANPFSSNTSRNSFTSGGRDTPATASTKSITYGIAGIDMTGNANRGSPDVKHVEVMLGEGSGPNKRAHRDESIESNTQTQQNSGAERTPNPQQPPAFQPGSSTGQPFFFQGIPAMPPAEPRPKKKGQKRTGKTATITPIVGLMDEETGFLDRPMSVRQLLKTQKVDLTWMDFCVWSPTVCRELKRLLTRMSNRKRKGKAAGNTGQDQGQAGNVNAIAVDGNTRFLSSVMGIDKAFRIPCKVRVGGKELTLQRHQVQADQGSDMNVVSLAMAKQLGLEIRALSDVGFAGLTMKTADNRETRLHHWVYLEIGVEGIWRTIRCFVAPDLDLPQKPDHLSLLLGIPWLYSVNAIIGIRGSRIEIGDPAVGESIRDVIGPELVFSKEHNLLMYPKAILTSNAPNSPDESDEDDEDSDSSVSLSDEEGEDEVAGQGFH